MIKKTINKNWKGKIKIQELVTDMVRSELKRLNSDKL